MSVEDIPLDSPKGMQMLAEWVRAHSFVLNEAHERMAAKHGVSMAGVIIARPIPLRDSTE